MKKLITSLLIFIICFNVICVNIVASEEVSELSWYVKRRGKAIPEFPPEAKLLSDYNARCIGNEEERRLYLTFDAGYSNENVSKILDILRDEKIPAAFFILDNIIVKNTDIVKRMIDEGHLVCNHTKRHRNLCNSSVEEIEKDLRALEEVYYTYTGEIMEKYFRFPEGKYSIEALKAVSNLGYKTVFWSFGYEDWDNSRQLDNLTAKKKILSNTHNGAVILLHPTSKTNASILREVISEWRKMGYTFGTLDELFS